MPYHFATLAANDIVEPLPSHFHEEFAVGVTSGGAHWLIVGKGRYLAPPGSVVAFNPYVLHAAETADESGWSYRMLYLPREMVQSFMCEESQGAEFARLVVSDVRAAFLIGSLYQAHADGVRSLEQEESTLELLTRLMTPRHHGQTRNANPAEHAAVSRVLEVIHERSPESITLASLADIAALHPRYLIRVFTARLGIPPHAYLQRVRIAKAQGLLRDHESLAKVAAMAGFSDQSHMTREFKRYLGTTPGAYRRRNFLRGK
jgi:AraC-like DNA-binding protein